jgi:hypothetical protein
MQVRLPVVFVSAAFASLLAAPASAVPQPRSALVLEKSGTVTPDVKPFSEIKAGTIVALGAGSRLKFLHYPTCTTVVVSKGSVRFGEKDYEVVGGKPDSAKTASCPRRVALKEVGEAGAGNLRSMDEKLGAGTGQAPLTFPPKPEFVLVGEHADDYATLRIVAGGQQILDAPFTGPKFEWPKNAPPLKKNASYEFTLLPKALGVGKVKQSFQVQGTHNDDGDPAMFFVIDLD